MRNRPAARRQQPGSLALVVVPTLSLLVAPVATPISADPVSYEQLERLAFQATAPPRDAVRHARDFGVAACARIEPAPEMTFRVVSRGSEARVRAKLQRPAFRAAFDPACSFWSRASARSVGGRLMHAQVHFALTEIAARRLAARLLADVGAFVATSRSAASAVAPLQTRLDAALDQADADARARGALFDQELLAAAAGRSTISGARSLAEARRHWLGLVEAELAALAFGGT